MSDSGSSGPSNLLSEEIDTALDKTPYAEKYGELEAGHSGLTPGVLLFPGRTIYQLNFREKREYEDTEQFQRDLLRGYTTTELMNIDAISTRVLKQGNLCNGLNPVLANWETAPHPGFKRKNLYSIDDPLGAGNGEWRADNPVVKKILNPVLVLASRILEIMYKSEWYLAALLIGERRLIDPTRLPRDSNGNVSTAFGGYQFYSFHTPRKTSYNPMDFKQTVDDRLKNLVQDNQYEFGFMEQCRDPDSEGVLSDSVGLTFEKFLGQTLKPKIFTFLSYRWFSPLLRSDLVDSERMGLEYYLACTIAHELMHAIVTHFGDEADWGKQDEPYFEDDPVAEIGFSMETNVFGGRVDMMLATKPNINAPPSQPSIGYWAEVFFPSTTDVVSPPSAQVVLNGPQAKYEQVVVPILVSHFENIQQEEFWNVSVRNFGFDMLRNSTFSGERIENGVIKRQPLDRLSQLEENANRLQKLSGLDAMQKQAIQHVEAILETAENLMLSKYSFNELQREMQALFDTMQGSDLKVQETVSQLLETFSKTIQSHEMMSNFMILEEKSRGTIDTDRRLHLLTWNRRAREFARIALQPNITNKIQKQLLQARFVKLERCRMRLWCPADGEVSCVEENDEAVLLKEAYTTLNIPDQVKISITKLSQISRDPMRSLFADASALVMSAAIQQIYGFGRTYTRALANAMLVLEDLADECPQTWKLDVLRMKNIAHSLHN